MGGRRLGDRNVKPKHVDDYEREEEDNEFEDFDEDLISDPDADEDEESRDESSDEATDDGHEDDAGVEEDEGDVHDQVANVSFGALLQAQDALSRKRKRGSDTTAEQDAKLEQVRARLHDFKAGKAATKSLTRTSRETNRDRRLPPNNQAGHETTRSRKAAADVEGDPDSDSDSGPSEEEAPTKSRSSKHAPTTQSSKHQVTRKRTVVDVPKRVIRDPRFDALHQNSAHTGNSDKAYAFLRDYQKSEIAELKTAIKAARTENDKETLKRKLVSMENRIKSKEAQERQQEVLRRHRKEEREKVEQGKKPFFLKRKDVKERAMAERFQGLKKKDQQKLIDRRKKREGEKEMRRMPDARRVAG